MTIKRVDAREMLTQIGVARWETNPPSAGVITWLDAADKVVARGRYQVILSWGPGIQYTMGWAVSSYGSMGIPFVAKEHAGEPGFVAQAGRTPEDVQEEAYRRADDVAAKVGAAFAYQASTLLLAISGFEKAGAAAKPAPVKAEKPAAAKPAAEKPAKKKPAAKTSAVKKTPAPAAKKPVPKKPAPKKPAPKKPAPKKSAPKKKR